MRGLVQRVSRASVSVGGESLGAIERGLVVFLGVGQGDTREDARHLVDKTLHLRVFPDDAGRFERSVVDVAGGLLVVSQFTLYADTRRGRRPSFTGAARPEEAEGLYLQAVEMLRESGLPVVTGRFQERMVVELHNDGPVTIWLDSAERHQPRR